MSTFRALVVFILSTILSQQLIAGWEWVVIERGDLEGTGFKRDRWDAINECAANLSASFIRAAQRCCENDDPEYPQYRGRCAGGSERPRSFDGGLNVYNCWPSPTRAEYYPATGYYMVYHRKPFTCSELIDTSLPGPTPQQTEPANSNEGPLPLPIPIATPIPVAE
jgi:hypothetical protein